MINDYLNWTIFHEICPLMLEIIPEIKTDIKKETLLEDICFDKFGLDLLRPKLEEKYSILITDSELDSFKTVADIVNFIRSRSKKL